MRNKLLNSILPSVFFFAVIAIMTYPLILKLTTCIPGFFSTDESFAIVWSAWLTKFSFLNHLVLNYTDFISYPFGVEFFSNRLISYVWVSINYLLAIFTTPVLTYNIQIIMNLFLSAICVYLLVSYLTKNRFAGIFSGIAFGFCPYLFMRSWQHLGETYVWPMPLFLWITFRLKDDLRLRVKVIFILSLVLAAINYAVIYYTSVVFICLLLYLVAGRKVNFSYIRSIICLSLMAVVVLLPQFFPVLVSVLGSRKSSSASVWNVFHRPFEDLFAQAAKPLSYFLPSATHPVFGRFTEQFVGTQLYGTSFTEHTLYLGWTTIILAVFAVRAWRKNKRLKVADRHFYNFGFFILLAITAWFFSQSPWWQIGPMKILMPSSFMYKILPMFRAYCRFGIVVMLAVSVLAGYGVKLLLEKYKPFALKSAVTSLLCVLLLFEFWSYPPYKVIDISRAPLVYDWLKLQPKDTVIAEYPLDTDSPNEMYRLFQIFHEKRMINYTIPSSDANKLAKEVMQLSDKEAVHKLKTLGVKYALVHRGGYLQTDLVEDKKELERIPDNLGLKLIKSYAAEACADAQVMCIKETGPIDVYEIIGEK